MSQKIKDVNFTPHWVQLDKLSPHPTIQRPLVAANVKKLKKAFDANALSPVRVVADPRNNGYYWVWEGQHQVWVLKELFGGTKTVLCWVYDLDEERLADLQNKFNDRTPWQAIDKFHMGLTAKYPDVVDIVKIISAKGLTVGRKKGDGGIGAVIALRTTYRRLGAADFETMISTLCSAWGDDPDGFHTSILNGVALFIKTNNGAVIYPILSEKLKKFGTPAKFIGQARTYAHIGEMPLARAVADLVTNIYNKRRRTTRVVRSAGAA